MHILIVCFIVVVISTPIFLLLIRDFRRRQTIHVYLKRQIHPLKSELKSYEHNPAKQFELLDPIYRAVVFQTHSKLKMKRALLEEMVSEIASSKVDARRSGRPSL